MKNPVEFERRAGEKTVVQIEDAGGVKELTLTVVSTTATFCRLRIEPGDLVKRVLKEEPESRIP